MVIYLGLRKIILLYLILSVFVFYGSNVFSEELQKSSLDGQFYPRQRHALEGMISGFLENAGSTALHQDVVAIISPHAGYQYSGQAAGFAFKAIMDKGFSTAIIVASSHRHYFKGLSVLDRDAYITPLGRVDIDKDITKNLLLFNENIRYYPQTFLNENSTETLIPFVQYALPGAKIVIILIGDQSYDTCMLVQDALYSIMAERKDIVIIASTDMSHFSSESQARHIDMSVIQEIRKFNPENLFLYLSEMKNKDRPCGLSAVVSTMLAAKRLGADKIDILKYTTSADMTGDKSSVVGYMSAVIARSSDRDSETVEYQKESEADMENLLNTAQKRRLLEIARSSIESYLKTGEHAHFKETDKVLNQEMGAFVTLHKDSQLRGCIGNIIGQGPLYLTVSEMAVQSAVNDPRFPRLRPEELDSINIEISVLSPLEKIDDPDKIIVGRHGVLVKSGFKSGVYLPQVATETGWGRDQFMDSLCMHKAGIARDSWRTNRCDIYIFSAEVFSE
jgi:MEMO1 family protein